MLNPVRLWECVGVVLSSPSPPPSFLPLPIVSLCPCHLLQDAAAARLPSFITSYLPEVI